MSVLALSPLLDTSAATPLHADLLGLMERREAIALDGSAVSKVGLACLQLIAAARSMAGERGLGFSLVDPSHALREMAALAGLTAIFDSVD